MARSRNIKPGFFKNELLGTADPYVQLLFAGLWTLADKSGILEDRPLRIKAEIFPYRDCLDINGYLTQLLSLGFINRYEADGVALIQIVNFKKHQNPHHTEKPSEYTEYSGTCQQSVKQPLNNGYTPADSLIPDSLIPDTVKAKKAPASPVAKAPKFSAFDSLIALGVDAQVANDFISLRKRKRADLTQTALDIIVKEAKIAGITVDAAITKSVARGWQSFEAEWYDGHKPKPYDFSGVL